MKKSLILLAAAVIAVNVEAKKTTTWNVAHGGNFNDAANWDNGVPAAGDTVWLVLPGATAAFTNDIEGLSISVLNVSNTVANAAQYAQLSGFGITLSYLTAKCSVTSTVPLTATGNMSVSVLEGYKLYVDAPVTVGGDLNTLLPTASGSSSLLVNGAQYLKSVTVGGTLKHTQNTAAQFFGDVTAGRMYYGVYWTGANVSFRNGKVTVDDMDVGVANYYFYTSDALAPTTVLTWDLVSYLASDNGSSGRYYFDCATMTIDRPHCDVVPVKKKSGAWNDSYYVGTSAADTKSTLTMKATASDVSYAKFVGGLSLVYDPQGDHTLVCSNTVHTMNGMITVKGGTLTFNGATTLANVTKVTVDGGTFKLDSTTANALSGATALKVASGATFRATGAAAGSPFAAGGIGRVDISGTGKLALGEGVAFTAQVLMVKGIFPAAKTYTGEGYGEGEIEEAKWIEGPGRVTVVNTGYTSWKEPVSGNWNDATKWTGGVPTRDLQTYVSAEGSDYTVTVDGELMPATFVIATEANGKITLDVQNATFTNASLTVGRNAILEVPDGGSFWYQGVPNVSGKNRTSPVKPAESPTTANTFVKIQDGGVFKVTGGTAVFTNYIGYVAVGGSDGSTGTVSVTAGTLKFTRNYALDRIVVYKGGLMDFSGTGAFVPVGLGNVIGVNNAGADPSVIYRGSALNKGKQWFAGQGETVYDLKTNPFASTPTEFVIAPTYPNDGSTAVAMQHKTTVNLTNANLSVGKNHFIIAGGCPDGSVYNAGDEVGILNVQNGGRVDYSGSNNTDGNYLDGLAIGYGAFSYFVQLVQLYGELNVLDGGAFTNVSGYTSVGVSRGSGRICVDGGSFRHGSTRMFLLGVAGGTADCVVKDGTLSVNANDAYIGGAWTNVFRQGRYLYTWGWRPGNHSATGTFRQEGGTATFAHRVLLGVDGCGTIEQIGSTGTFSAQTLVFSNSVFNAEAGGTAKFVFDANGARTVTVTDRLVLGANAKLVVDSADYPTTGRSVKLFTCPGGIEGTFSEVSLTGAFSKRARLVYNATSVRLAGISGTVLVVR